MAYKTFISVEEYESDPKLKAIIDADGLYHYRTPKGWYYSYGHTGTSQHGYSFFSCALAYGMKLQDARISEMIRSDPHNTDIEDQINYADLPPETKENLLFNLKNFREKSNGIPQA
jgi:hypothetical protein